MVKVVVGEESQVGLVIGNLSGKLDRGFIFDLVPTPLNDNGEPACSIIGGAKDDRKKASKGKSLPHSSALFIDKDWLAEHARQAAKAVAEVAPLLEVDWDERLLVHIGYSPLRLPIYQGSSSKRLVDILHHGISIHAKELKGAKALIDGKLANEDEQFDLGGVHDVEFLLPFMEDKYLEVYSQKEITGLLVFSGSVCSYAYSNSKEPSSQALADIKEDIIKSLRSRLDIMCDEADRKSDSKEDRTEESNNQILSGSAVLQLDLQLQRKHCSMSFPRRVFLPWLADTFLCDYIQPSESVEVLVDHFAELMSLEFPSISSKILEPEAEAEAPALVLSTTKSFREVSTPYALLPKSDDSLSNQNRAATILRSDQKSTNPAGFNFMIAVLVLVVSVVVGFVVFFVRSSS
uniref:Zinc binding dehydrogenase n=1 Tax=Solanum tuberosum TaxID=4113 RepID=M1BN16_SOLTU